MRHHTTREGWLKDGIRLIKPWFEELEVELPEVYVAVSFPATGGRSGKTIGQCHYRSRDGKPHVMIHPYLEDPARVLDVLIHELIHAALGAEAGHKAGFKAVAEALGLTGKMTATTATPELAETLTDMARRGLGPYPHAALQPYVPKQKNRHFKIVCTTLECPSSDEKGARYQTRTSKKWFESWGAVCPACEEPMEMEEAA
ncbi:SprT-like domain-containing protein [Spirillospora sp. NPDC127200]